MKINWAGAAEGLRTLLGHVLCWRIYGGLAIRGEQDYCITREDVQSLQLLLAEELNGCVEVDWERGERPCPRNLHSESSASWLAEDADLAEQVASAWNSVLAREGAAEVVCGCSHCDQRSGAA